MVDVCFRAFPPFYENGSYDVDVGKIDQRSSPISKGNA